MDSHAALAFRKVFDTLNNALVLTDRHDQLPEHALFGPDQKANQKRLDSISDDVLAILGVSDVTVLRDEYRRTEDLLTKARARIKTWRIEQATAPQRSVLSTTRAQFQTRIEEGEALIRSLDGRRENAIYDLVSALKKLGIEVTRQQARLVLAAATGGEQLALHAAFHNVKQVLEQLACLNRAANERASDAKRYYGLYMVLLRVLVHAHDQFLAAIRTRYLPKLVAIQVEVQAIREKSVDLLSRTPESGGRRMLEVNLRSQDITEKAAATYEDFLERQVHALERARERLLARAAVVANTYQTVSVAAELVTLMDESHSELNALHDMELPDLIGFDTPELQDRFAEITRKIMA